MLAITPRKLSHKKNGGFTLIEMSIVIIILGIAIAAFAPIYSIYQKNLQSQATQKNINNIAAAIGSFRGVNGRYPCPASLVANRNDPNYGREDCSDHGPASASPVALGTCDTNPGGTGLCMEQSIATRTLSYLNPYNLVPPVTGDPQPTAVGPIPVRVGGIPFRELNIDENDAYDGYNHRIMYAVTQHLTNDKAFRANEGGIDILGDTPGKSIVTPPGSAHFIVYSFGEDGAGGYSRTGGGASRLPCPATSLEKDNCDITPTAEYRLAQSNGNAGDPKFFDDIMTYFTQSQIPLWQISRTATVNDSIMQKPGGDVGVDFPSANFNFVPETQYETTKVADIKGDLRASETSAGVGGNIAASKLCSSTGADCFSVNLIGGSIATGGGMQCPAGYATQVINGTLNCTPPYIKCISGVITGINADGSINCNANASCAETDVTLCPGSTPSDTTGAPTTYHLAARPSGITLGPFTAGASYSQSFTCKNHQWTPKPHSGVCTCTPHTETQNPVCGDGFSGNVTQTREYQCPAGTYTDWTPAITYTGDNGTFCQDPATGCTCASSSVPVTPTCDPGYAPVNGTRTETCDAAQPNCVSVTTTPGTCQCVGLPTQVTFAACGGNQTGQIKTTTTYACDGSGNLTSSTATDDTACHCTEITGAQDVSCPGNQTGLIHQTYKNTCPSGQVILSSDSSDCKNPPPVTCTWQSSGTSTPVGSGAFPYLGDSCDCDSHPTVGQCYTGSSGNWQAYSPCVCSP